MSPATGVSAGRASALSGWRGGVLLAALCVLVHLPGLFSLPPVDRDESRFAQASKQMLQSGRIEDWVVPRVGDTPRLNKPPLIYWLQAGSGAMGRAVGGTSNPPSAAAPFDPTGGIGWFRLPSALSAAIAAIATWRLGLSMFGARHARTAWLAGALLATSLVVIWDAHQARADQALLAATTIAMASLWRAWRTASAEPTQAPARVPLTTLAALWASMAAGVMIKGPITPMIALLTIAALSAASGRWRWIARLRPLLGAGFVVAVIGTWAALVAAQVGWSAYAQIISDEVLGRSVAPAEGHWGPPGYHLVLLPLMFWPGSLLTAAGILVAWRQCRRGATTPTDAPRTSPGDHAAPGGSRLTRWLGRFDDQRPADLFLLAWLVPAWVVFELISTKLPHYTMPLYPALALLSARAVMMCAVSDQAPALLGLRAAGPRLGLAIWVTLGALIAAAPILLWRLGTLAVSGGTMLVIGLLAGCAAGAVASAAIALWRWNIPRAQAMGLSASVLSVIAALGIVLPRLGEPWISSRLAGILHSADPLGTAPIAAIGYHEDSLKFLTDGRMDRLGLPSLGQWLTEHPQGLVILPRSMLEQASQGLPGAWLPLGEASGFNYSKGERVDLVVVRRHADPEARSRAPERVSW